MTKAVVRALAVLTLAAASAAAQSPLDRGPTRGFDFAVVPSVSLGFNAVRMWQADSTPTGCSGGALRCYSYGPGNAPTLGADITMPLGRYFGLSFGGAVSAPHRVRCKQDTDCESDATEHLTALRGSALLLFRLKPQAPIFIGLGYSATRWSPGPVAGQDSTVNEYGPVLELAFDFALGEQVGLRVAWWNYWLGVDPNTINAIGGADCGTTPGSGGACYTLESTAHDQRWSFGARIRLPK